MKSSPIVQNVTLSSATVSTEIFPVIGSIRPDWNSSNTRLVTFTEGITNTIIGLFDSRTPNDESQALVIKIYGAQTELFIDRKVEVESMMKLSDSGVLTQRVLIQLNNGIIYEYASGKACSRDDVRKENIAELIAIKMAQLHSVPVEEKEQPYIITLLHKFVDLLNENGAPITDRSLIISDIDTIENRILPRLIPNAQVGKDLVLCHNDLLVKNIIYDAKHESISFIDFEYIHLNYALFDIADHFVEYAGVDDADFSLYPTRDEQRRWLAIYFRARGMDESLSNDATCRLVDQFAALAHLMWGLWALLQARISHLDFDYVNYAQLRLDNYKRLRPLLFDTE